MDLLLTGIPSIVVGLGVGILAGLLGVGGGTILIPLFKLVYGMPSLGSTATSLFTIIPTSLSGAFNHWRAGTCLPLLGLAIGLGGALTSPLGVWLATGSPDWLVMVVAAACIAYSAVKMVRKAIKKPVAPLAEKPAAEGDSTAAPTSGAQATAVNSAVTSEGHAIPSDTAEQNSAAISVASASSALPRSTYGKGVAGGLVAGVFSGYIGLGGGFLIMPLLTEMLGVPLKKASGTSLIAVMVLAIPGVITQAMLGNIQWVAGIAVALGSIPGTFIGVRLLPKVNERALRLLFGGLLLFAALMLVIDQLGVL